MRMRDDRRVGRVAASPVAHGGTAPLLGDRGDRPSCSRPRTRRAARRRRGLRRRAPRTGRTSGRPATCVPSGVNAGPLRIETTRAPRSRHHSSSSTAWSTSDSVRNGTAKIRSWYAKPQSSSSQRLNARRMWIDASMSGCIGPSMHTPCDGNSHAASTPCSSMHRSRASRSNHSGCSAGSSHANSLPTRALVLRAGEVVVQRARLRAQVHVTGPGDDRVEPLAERCTAACRRRRRSRTPRSRELRVAVAGEGVARLPVVVVGVEDRRDLRRSRSPSCPAPRFSRCRGGAACRASPRCTRPR